MNSPLVTVIMNCLNGAEYLRPALDSVFAQSLTDWELVFWDNCSTDKSGEIARAYGDRIRYFRGNEIIPLSAGRAEAAKRARGRYLALLDTDDLWDPKFLAQTTALLDSNPNLGVVWSDAWQVRADGSEIVRYSQFTRFRRGMQFENLLREQFISPSSAMVFRADAVREVGGWRSQFTMMADAELLLRLALSYELDYVKEPLSRWRSHGSNASSRLRDCFLEWDAIIREWRGRTLGPPVRRSAFSEYSLRMSLKMTRAALGAGRSGMFLEATRNVAVILVRHPSLWIQVPKMARRLLPAGIRTVGA